MKEAKPVPRFVNDPDNIVDKTVRGFVAAHDDLCGSTRAPRVVMARGAPVAGKVGVVTGGGSVGVGLALCTLLANGKSNVAIAPGTMEGGIGHRRGPGTRVEPLEPADAVADDMLGIVLGDRGIEAGEAACVLPSGLGGTPVNEPCLLYGRVERGLAARGVRVARALVGNYVTSLDMMGATLTVKRLDAEPSSLLAHEAACPALRVTS